MCLSNDELEYYTRLAGQAARATRDVLRKGRENRCAPRSQIGRDIKLAEDTASEAEIGSVLSRESKFPILSEEGGWLTHEQSAGAPHWVIDPLDGSFNYFRGVPLYGVSIALCVDRTPLLGAIFDPERDELFLGNREIGLHINGQPVQPRTERRQILATGFPAHADVNTTSARVTELAQNWKKIRMIGSAALSLAWVAAGRFDGYSENGIMWWDVAAGLSLVSSAGLREIRCEACAGHAVNVFVAW
jgi:myo-inositol-1(or 4)-monophosphatase